MPSRRRAAPLPPDERRRAIVEAITPLLITHGPSLTTRRMAVACDVAEGTLFRVFDDKQELIRAAVQHAIDPRPFVEALASIDRDLDFEAQVTAMAHALDARASRLLALHTALQEWAHAHHDHGERGVPAFVRDAEREVTDAIADLFVEHRDRLAVSPARAALVLRSVIVGSHHHALRGGDRMDVDEIVTVVLHGIDDRVREEISA